MIAYIWYQGMEGGDVLNYPKADLGKRFVAALIDGVIAGILTILIPILGGLLGAAYTLTKDALMFQLTKDAQWKNRSIGKKLMSLQVVNLGGGDVDMTVSIKRNATLSIGSLLAAIPLAGWVLSPIVGGIIGIIEVVLVFTDPAGRRLGDKWANTQVVGAPEPQPSAGS
ncbi:MAG: RDD family protein [Bacillota bacterium]|nr:RDD family protein [Bacillota bacterium]